MSTSSASILLRQYKELNDPKKGIPSFHIELENGNIFSWIVGVMVLNEDSVYHGGYFKAQMKFPNDFPYSPPTFKFTPPIYHPNVYKDGRLCISILHQSGDPTSEEPDAETWRPTQSVESVLVSIVSLLEDPNISSPANVDAAVDWKKNRSSYNSKVKTEVERSKQDIPDDFIMPTSKTAYSASNPINYDNNDIDEDFWYSNDESFDDDDDNILMNDFSDNDMEDEEYEEEDDDYSQTHNSNTNNNSNSNSNNNQDNAKISKAINILRNQNQQIS
ncbi:SCF E2 ubiquitin-protein ligase catalytic subunit CDC34 ASCRUDRAFT_74380 [Ascoidea rubescens DSM 1968]|uniref:UBC core domain-containing protein n=1 Tax=Ascoidea rubescens DSM 1968 TaxID=1344418 RepID=A0A1D2VMX5_9ASCO|nr:hypothetical protein ASCRUDRAFT_74380 [Ascoidea rubescens DSM 1968]ODV62934.1 hypothetical protein ASCRUDRAFT_74380 [Ascoidea rubescens DSM 1968]